VSGESEPAVDLEGALRWVGGDRRLLRELIELFVDDMPKRLTGLKEATATRDVRQLERLAHTLKGSAGILGAGALQVAAQGLEEAMRARRLEVMPELLAALERELERVGVFFADPGWRTFLGQGAST
jgi:HPt (histidine-containing phosphotransfer) domain-containing protein